MDSYLSYYFIRKKNGKPKNELEDGWLLMLLFQDRWFTVHLNLKTLSYCTSLASMRVVRKQFLPEHDNFNFSKA